MNEDYLYFPYALDTVFKINGVVYELLDREFVWNPYISQEVYTYKMRKWNDNGNWFEVSQAKMNEISQKYSSNTRKNYLKEADKAFN